MRIALAVGIAIALGACARSSVLPIANDMIQISTSAAPICGPAGAQDAAVKRAAMETIARGYDSFLIVDAAAQTTRTFAGYTPTTVNTYGTATATRYGDSVYANGQSRTVINQGGPVAAQVDGG